MRARIWRDLVAKIRTASLEKEPASPLRLREKRELVTYRRRRPVGPEKMSLPLQQMYAMTRDVKKTWPASLEEVAADLEDDL